MRRGRRRRHRDPGQRRRAPGGRRRGHRLLAPPSRGSGGCPRTAISTGSSTASPGWPSGRIAAYDFELTGFTEDLQFTSYDETGAFYTWHQDGLDGEVAGRKLSIVIQLSASTDYEGSDLELLDVVEDYPAEDLAAWRRRVRRRGTAVLFPAFEYHRVTPLVRGTRHSLVCWIGGPPFR
ncbi:MAG: 2OG-Fe(II) oxygenase [Acidimicrobiia bacterium]|nr:2OG-Fe(II) oxygenase [Acidimicrobiia bacterium]